MTINPGEVYVIEVPIVLSCLARLKLEEYLRTKAPASDFIILEGGVTIAKEDNIFIEG